MSLDSSTDDAKLFESLRERLGNKVRLEERVASLSSNLNASLERNKQQAESIVALERELISARQSLPRLQQMEQSAKTLILQRDRLQDNFTRISKKASQYVKKIKDLTAEVEALQKNLEVHRRREAAEGLEDAKRQKRYRIKVSAAYYGALMMAGSEGVEHGDVVCVKWDNKLASLVRVMREPNMDSPTLVRVKCVMKVDDEAIEACVQPTSIISLSDANLEEVLGGRLFSPSNMTEMVLSSNPKEDWNRFLVRFVNETCKVVFDKYCNGRPVEAPGGALRARLDAIKTDALEVVAIVAAAAGRKTGLSYPVVAPEPVGERRKTVEVHCSQCSDTGSSTG